MPKVNYFQNFLKTGVSFLLLVSTFSVFGLAADDTELNLTVTTGELTVTSPETAALTGLNIASSDQTTSANIADINVTDLRGSNAGWTLTAKVDNLSKEGGSTLPSTEQGAIDTPATDSFSSLALDSSGNKYTVLDNYQQRATSTTLNGVNISTSATSRNALIKFNSNNEAVWSVDLEETVNDNSIDYLIVDSTGMTVGTNSDLYLTGKFKDTASGNTGGIFVAKINTVNGNLLWYYKTGTVANTTGAVSQVIVVDNTNQKIHLVNGFQGNLQLNTGTSVTSDAGNYDGLLLAIDINTGNYANHVKFGGNSYNYLTGLDLDPSTGEVYVVGDLYDGQSIGGVTPNGDFIAKYNGSNYTNVWAESMGGTSQIRGVSFYNNEIYALGGYGQQYSNDVTIQGQTLSSTQNQAFYIAKFQTDKTLIDLTSIYEGGGGNFYNLKVNDSGIYFQNFYTSNSTGTVQGNQLISYGSWENAIISLNLDYSFSEQFYIDNASGNNVLWNYIIQPYGIDVAGYFYSTTSDPLLFNHTAIYSENSQGKFALLQSLQTSRFDPDDNILTANRTTGVIANNASFLNITNNALENADANGAPSNELSLVTNPTYDNISDLGDTGETDAVTILVAEVNEGAGSYDFDMTIEITIPAFGDYNVDGKKLSGGDYTGFVTYDFL